MSLERSGRVIVYPNEVSLEDDILRTNMYRMVDTSLLAQSILGNGVSNSQLAAGLVCTQASPPTATTVLISQGAFYQISDYDATDYSSIPAETTIQLYKQFPSLGFTTVSGLAIPGSGTNYYLIQAQGVTTDVNPTNRPYYNSSNPTVPQYNNYDDTRLDSVVFSLKLSTVSTPTPDSGKVGLYAVTIPNTATTILNNMISVYPGAPFVNNSIFSAVTYDQLQKSTPIFAVDTGTANALVANPTPAYTSIVSGSHIYVKIANANTGTTSANINGLGSISVSYTTLLPLQGGELVAGMIAELFFDGTRFQLLNPVSTSLIPTGVMLDYAGTSVPAGGFLLCDGSEISRTTYAALFTAIGTTWGSGDGSTTYNIPDSRRSVAVGSGGSGSAELGNVTGNIGGEETHTMTLTELVSHGHGISDPGHSHALTAYDVDAGGGFVASTESHGSSNNPGTSSVTTGITVQLTGSGDAFNVIQPSYVITKIIKY